jgi:hypothetical protein
VFGLGLSPIDLLPGLLRVASNIRVRLVAERTPLGKNLLAAMQNAGFPIRRQLNLSAATMSAKS